MMETRSPFSTPTMVGNNSCRRNFSDVGLSGDGNPRPFKKGKKDNLIFSAKSRFSFQDGFSSRENIAPRRIPQALNKKPTAAAAAQPIKIHKQFWKAGDYDGAPQPVGGGWEAYAGGSDHIRVHPRFLHSNATSHRWVLGAFAELLDNSLDEIRNGASFVNVDMVKNKKGGGRMLVVEDNGGGMDPTRIRQCMSLGYSAKSKIANTIGQYGNGFKTSTMRLGADVIVFSRCRGRNGIKPTQSVGLLSYTFLRCTQKEDIEVPMLDFERKGQSWERIVRATSSADGEWDDKVNTIVAWSPFCSEAEILEQFNAIKDQGTRILIYNLWEDDQRQLELDFDVDPHDIQIRGANRDEKNIQMAKQYPNSRHFLTYKHSLRSYASILYLRLPRGFRMLLRGKEIEHHNIVNDMMISQKMSYRPQQVPDSITVMDSYNMVANVTIGFVKDAKAHIDVQGFNVYHKNRLIKPFWRVWNPSGSDGRCVIGVLEANFVEPAHDKQGFEKTIALQRLEAKLTLMQKNYWSTNCHLIGYAPRRNKKAVAEKAQADDQHQGVGSSGPDSQDSGSSGPEIIPFLRKSAVNKNSNGKVTATFMDGARKNSSLASKSGTLNVVRTSLPLPSNSADKSPNGNVTGALNGARKHVSLPSKSMDENPVGNITGTLNGEANSVPLPSKSPSDNITGTLDGAGKNVSWPSKSMDKTPSCNITGTMNCARKSVSLPPSKSMDKSPNGNNITGSHSMEKSRNMNNEHFDVEKSKGNSMNNGRFDVGRPMRVQNKVQQNKTIHKKKKKNRNLRRNLQRDLPAHGMQRAEECRPSQKTPNPPSPMIQPEKSNNKTAELNANLESSEGSTENMAKEDPMVEMLKIKEQELSSLLKDLELVKKKFDSDLDQERNKCKSLLSELNQEREKSKFLKSELNQENGKCKFLEAELSQEREKCKSLQSENHELKRGQAYLIDVFAGALSSRNNTAG